MENFNEIYESNTDIITSGKVMSNSGYTYKYEDGQDVHVGDFVNITTTKRYKGGSTETYTPQILEYDKRNQVFRWKDNKGDSRRGDLPTTGKNNILYMCHDPSDNYETRPKESVVLIRRGKSPLN
jgi:hypothetical protein